MCQVILEILWLAACQVVPEPAAGFADKVPPSDGAGKDLPGDLLDESLARRLQFDDPFEEDFSIFDDVPAASEAAT